MPYEIYFYSSGAVEEGWDESDMQVNRANAIVGFGLGGLISVGILVASAQVLKPAGISPTSVGTVALVAEQPYAQLGLILAFIGILFAVAGATIDTAFSAAYNLAQHQGWKWGKRFRLPNEPRFTLSLAGFLLIGFAIAQTRRERGTRAPRGIRVAEPLSPGSAARRRPAAFAPRAEPPEGGDARAGSARPGGLGCSAPRRGADCGSAPGAGGG
jgi:hypothetical protein